MSAAPLRIVFAGTPDFAATCLDKLLSHGYPITAVYTQPDRPSGRGRKLMPGPVKLLAIEHQLPVYQPLSLRTAEAQAELASLKPDLMIVVAYGLLLPQEVLDIPRLGCINVHASILPRWRGAAPIERALLAGDTETGITIMQMNKGLDTGDMLSINRCPIQADDTGATLHDRLAELGASALLEILPMLADGKANPQPQDDALACYASKLSKEEGLLDWSLSAAELSCKVRGLNPRPIAYTRLGDETLRVWQASAIEEQQSQPPGTICSVSKKGVEVATGSGTLRLEQLQLPGGKAQPLASLLNGNPQRFTVGQRFH
ncbi:methionyl-tRNA formyltransferase [Nitrincola sp. MINF-07-Sa-05]|uniref:methionyl-tRNA formyltransferase n=1 Tax=Nitrincola salilacus TaxID=3400273 RepID=UPI0039184DCE